MATIGGGRGDVMPVARWTFSSSPCRTAAAGRSSPSRVGAGGEELALPFRSLCFFCVGLRSRKAQVRRLAGAPRELLTVSSYSSVSEIGRRPFDRIPATTEMESSSRGGSACSVQSHRIPGGRQFSEAHPSEKRLLLVKPRWRYDARPMCGCICDVVGGRRDA